MRRLIISSVTATFAAAASVSSGSARNLNTNYIFASLIPPGQTLADALTTQTDNDDVAQNEAVDVVPSIEAPFQYAARTGKVYCNLPGVEEKAAAAVIGKPYKKPISAAKGTSAWFRDGINITLSPYDGTNVMRFSALRNEDGRSYGRAEFEKVDLKKPGKFRKFITLAMKVCGLREELPRKTMPKPQKTTPSSMTL